jgi:hypothetical protein
VFSSTFSKLLIAHVKNIRLAHVFIRKTMKTMFFCLEKVSLTTKSVLLELPKTMPEIPVQTGPGVHPASCTMGTGSFLGVKRPGCGVDHLPPPSADVKERVELYLFSLSGPL